MNMESLEERKKYGLSRLLSAVQMKPNLTTKDWMRSTNEAMRRLKQVHAVPYNITLFNAEIIKGTNFHINKQPLHTQVSENSSKWFQQRNGNINKTCRRPYSANISQSRGKINLQSYSSAILPDSHQSKIARAERNHNSEKCTMTNCLRKKAAIAWEDVEGSDQALFNPCPIDKMTEITDGTSKYSELAASLQENFLSPQSSELIKSEPQDGFTIQDSSVDELCLSLPVMDLDSNESDIDTERLLNESDSAFFTLEEAAGSNADGNNSDTSSKALTASKKAVKFNSKKKTVYSIIPQELPVTKEAHHHAQVKNVKRVKIKPKNSRKKKKNASEKNEKLSDIVVDGSTCIPKPGENDKPDELVAKKNLQTCVNEMDRENQTRFQTKKHQKMSLKQRRRNSSGYSSATPVNICYEDNHISTESSSQLLVPDIEKYLQSKKKKSKQDIIETMVSQCKCEPDQDDSSEMDSGQNYRSYGHTTGVTSLAPMYKTTKTVYFDLGGASETSIKTLIGNKARCEFEKTLQLPLCRQVEEPINRRPQSGPSRLQSGRENLFDKKKKKIAFCEIMTKKAMFTVVGNLSNESVFTAVNKDSKENEYASLIKGKDSMTTTLCKLKSFDGIPHELGGHVILDHTNSDGKKPFKAEEDIKKIPEDKKEGIPSEILKSRPSTAKVLGRCEEAADVIHMQHGSCQSMKQSFGRINSAGRYETTGGKKETPKKDKRRSPKVELKGKKKKSKKEKGIISLTTLPKREDPLDDKDLECKMISDKMAENNVSVNWKTIKRGLYQPDGRALYYHFKKLSPDVISHNSDLFNHPKYWFPKEYKKLQTATKGLARVELALWKQQEAEKVNQAETTEKQKKNGKNKLLVKLNRGQSAH